jgi:hypothetical protein
MKLHKLYRRWQVDSLGPAAEVGQAETGPGSVAKKRPV